MFKYLGKFERFISTTILLMMGLVVFLATIEVGWILIRDIISPPIFLLGVDELLDLFGLFLLVLIGLEFMESIKIYILRRSVHLEMIVIIAIIAVLRKIVITDLEKLSGLMVMALSALALALMAGYYLVNKSRRGDDGDTHGIGKELSGEGTIRR